MAGSYIVEYAVPANDSRPADDGSFHGDTLFFAYEDILFRLAELPGTGAVYSLYRASPAGAPDGDPCSPSAGTPTTPSRNPARSRSPRAANAILPARAVPPRPASASTAFRRPCPTSIAAAGPSAKSPPWPTRALPTEPCTPSS